MSIRGCLKRLEQVEREFAHAQIWTICLLITLGRVSAYDRLTRANARQQRQHVNDEELDYTHATWSFISFRLGQNTNHILYIETSFLQFWTFQRPVSPPSSSSPYRGPQDLAAVAHAQRPRRTTGMRATVRSLGENSDTREPKYFPGISKKDMLEVKRRVEALGRPFN